MDRDAPALLWRLLERQELRFADGGASVQLDFRGEVSFPPLSETPSSCRYCQTESQADLSSSRSLLTSALPLSLLQRIDVLEILNPDLSLNETRFAEIGPIRLTPYFALSYGVSFAVLTSAITTVAIWHWDDIKTAFKSTDVAGDIHVESALTPSDRLRADWAMVGAERAAKKLTLSLLLPSARALLPHHPLLLLPHRLPLDALRRHAPRHGLPSPTARLGPPPLRTHGRRLPRPRRSHRRYHQYYAWIERNYRVCGGVDLAGEADCEHRFQGELMGMRGRWPRTAADFCFSRQVFGYMTLVQSIDLTSDMKLGL